MLRSGEEGHFKSNCQGFTEMTNGGIVHTKGDRRIYMGRTSDIPVNRQGYTTIKEAAIAQHAQNQIQPQVATSTECLNSIEIYGEVSAADVDAAEKRKSVHPAT